MINSNIYIITYREFKTQLLPTFLRKPKTLAVLAALIAPVRSLYLEFFAFKNDAIYKTQHDATVILLQKMLNDKFDNTERRIYINNAEIRDVPHFYDEGLGSPFYFYDEAAGDPVYFYDASVYNPSASDFTVFLPGAMRPVTIFEETQLLTRISAQLDYYKAFGTKYNFQWLN